MATKVPTAPPTTNVSTAPPTISDTYQVIQQVNVNSSRSSTCCCICWKTFDDELRERGFEGSDIEFNDIIIAGLNQVDTTKLNNLKRLKVFIAPVYLPLEPHFKCCYDCYCYCELCNYCVISSSTSTPISPDASANICPTPYQVTMSIFSHCLYCLNLPYRVAMSIFRHCTVWLSCCCCRGISCSRIEKENKQEFLITPSIQYDEVTFKFWKTPGYLGVRIAGNETKIALKFDKFVKIDNEMTGKRYALCITDVYEN
jgi:hypothetical protein